jgi:hypothetical protein
MRADEIADLLAKWFEEHSSLSCSGSLDEFSFDMNCRVSSLSKESFTLSSKHGDCSFRNSIMESSAESYSNSLLELN